MSSDEEQVVFTDDQMRGILARAIDIDGQHTLTLAQLRAVAAEIGVSPHALSVAIREETTRTPAMSSPARSVAGAHTAWRLVALGVPMGVVAGSLIASGPTSAVVGIMGVSLVVSGAVAMYESAAGTLRSFHLKNLLLWSGALVGSIAAAMLLSGGTERAPLLVAAGWVVRSWLASGILGSATVLAVHRTRQSTDPEAGVPPSLSTSAPRRWRQLASRLADTFDSWRRSQVRHHAPAA